MDTNRFTQKSLEALQAAQQLAQSYGNAQVEQVHLLDALLSQENGLIGQLMGKLGLNVQQVRTACEGAVNRLPKISGSNQQPYVTASLSQALTEAENQMKQMRDEYISVEHLFLGLLEKADSTVRPLFASLDITKPKFLEALQAVRGSARVTSEDPESTYDALKKYGQDLVELARQNKLDPVIGRDTEIRNAIRILSRKIEEQPGADRRAGRRQNGHRGGACAAYCSRRRAGQPEKPHHLLSGHGRADCRREIPRRV